MAAVVESAILVLGEVEAERDFRDVDSIALHLNLDPVHVHVLDSAAVLNQVVVSENYWMIAFVHLQMGPWTICKKLEGLNCMVCRISSNRYRGGCWGHSSCILYYRLESVFPNLR